MTAQLYRLGNGTRLVIDPDLRTRVSAVGMFLTAGSRLETPDNSGIAHFIEHMLFHGTLTRTAQQIKRAFNQLGGRIDAFTDKEKVAMTLETLNARAEDGISLLADLLGNPAFEDHAIEAGKKDVLQEIRSNRNSFVTLVHDQADEAAYPGQSIAAPILGTPESVRRLTPRQMRAFMADHCHGGNLVVGVAGDVDPDSVRENLERTIGTLAARPPSVLPPVRFDPQHLHAEYGSEQTHVMLVFNAKGLPPLPASILANAMGGLPSCRLVQEVREARGLAHEIRAGYVAARDAETFRIYLATDAAHVAEAVDVVCDEIVKVCEAGMTDEEFDTERKSLELSLAIEETSPITRVRQMLNHVIRGHDVRTIDEVHLQTAQVDPREIRAVARQIFSGIPAVISVGRASDDLSSRIEQHLPAPRYARVA